jgi:hypothetical protein
MLWLVLFFALIGVAIYIVDKKMKAKFEDKFNPRDWDLPSSVELPAELTSTSVAQAPIAPKLIAPQSALPLNTPVEKLGYQKKSSALSNEQTQIYKALRSALAGEYTLLTNVNVADTIAVNEANNALVAQVAVKNLSAKRFDFVVCDNARLTAICAIMLGDNLEPILVNACEGAGLPLARFRVQATYDIAIIRASILQAIGVVGVAERATEKSALEIVDAEPSQENTSEPTQAETTNEDAPIGNGIDLKICPSCSAVMLKRKAKNGVDAGKMFWICSTYPKCRGMLLIK